MASSRSRNALLAVVVVVVLFAGSSLVGESETTARVVSVDSAAAASKAPLGSSANSGGVAVLATAAWSDCHAHPRLSAERTVCCRRAAAAAGHKPSSDDLGPETVAQDGEWRRKRGSPDAAVNFMRARAARTASSLTGCITHGDGVGARNNSRIVDAAPQLLNSGPAVIDEEVTKWAAPGGHSAVKSVNFSSAVTKRKGCAVITAVFGRYESSLKPIQPQLLAQGFVNCTFIAFADQRMAKQPAPPGSATTYTPQWEVDTTPYHMPTVCNSNETCIARRFFVAKYYKLRFMKIPRLRQMEYVVWVDGTVAVKHNQFNSLVTRAARSAVNGIVSFSHERRSLMEEAVLSLLLTFHKQGAGKGYRSAAAFYESYIMRGFCEPSWYRCSSLQGGAVDDATTAAAAGDGSGSDGVAPTTTTATPASETAAAAEPAADSSRNATALFARRPEDSQVDPLALFREIYGLVTSQQRPIPVTDESLINPAARDWQGARRLFDDMSAHMKLARSCENVPCDPYPVVVTCLVAVDMKNPAIQPLYDLWWHETLLGNLQDQMTLLFAQQTLGLHVSRFERFPGIHGTPDKSNLHIKKSHDGVVLNELGRELARMYSLGGLSGIRGIKGMIGRGQVLGRVGPNHVRMRVRVRERKR